MKNKKEIKLYTVHMLAGPFILIVGLGYLLIAIFCGDKNETGAYIGSFIAFSFIFIIGLLEFIFGLFRPKYMIGKDKISYFNYPIFKIKPEGVYCVYYKDIESIEVEKTYSDHSLAPNKRWYIILNLKDGNKRYIDTDEILMSAKRMFKILNYYFEKFKEEQSFDDR